MTSRPPTTTLQLEIVPLDKIHESPLNPRKHFDPAQLASLAASLQAHGQLTPGVARPLKGKAGHVELAAGHRRYRAAKAAGLASLELKVRAMDDAEFAEILTIENDEREDVHPLEQAQGYRLLMETAGYDVAKIAARLQRSHAFVYDRLRLLQLTPELKALFLEDRFQLAHAIILARLSAEEQHKAARKPERGRSFGQAGEGGLWRTTGPTLDDQVFPLVPRTPMELEAWVARELRFKAGAVEIEELFPETAIALSLAHETGTRVVSISRDAHLRPNAQDRQERTFTRDFWRRADGLEGSKECAYAIVGVLVAGERRGESMGVCLRRDTCMIHWRTQATAAAAKEKAKKSGKPVAKAKREDPRQAARERAARIKARVTAAEQAAAAARIRAALDTLSDEEPSAAFEQQARAALAEYPAPALSAPRFIVALAAAAIHVDAWHLQYAWNRNALVKKCAALGIDVDRLTKGIAIAHCTFCGCSAEDACDPPCTWVREKPRVCSNPVCVALHTGKPVPAAAPGAPPAQDDDEDDDDDED